MSEDEKPSVPMTSAAAETEAMLKITEALIPLGQESRSRVISFVINYFTVRLGTW